MWNEADSAAFIESGASLVPDRDTQMEIICDLLPDPKLVVELCCGEGLLSEAVLQRFPECRLIGYDGSELMLARARSRNPARFEGRLFNLADGFPDKADAVISSLAIHHLDAVAKRDLYRRIFDQLSPGGTLVVADLTEPASVAAREIAAREWDRAAFPGTWNFYRYPDPETDKPSGLFEQLTWLHEIGYIGVDVLYLRAGHAIFTGIAAPAKNDGETAD
ncbi:MAG: Methyltransferase type 12 [Bryobacterales bacterium]|nr:Methyltransferase type 12 [Bryobacterales bacterium]